MTNPTVIVIPVPAADHLVSPYRLRFDPSGGEGMPAHITLLYPFLTRDRISADTLDALVAIASGEPAFSFELAEIRAFRADHNAALYLAPVPESPFVRLIEAIAVRWPEMPPYGGIYGRVVPHLTVGMLDLGAPEELIRRELEPRLPIGARAEEVWIMARNEVGRWVKVSCTKLGPASPSTHAAKE
ncbi:MAG: 2'-5' RNA ligase family protein [Bacteroidota bacterium]